MSPLLRTTLLFALAALAEIGGGYLCWKWLRENAALWVGAVGGVILASYGVVQSWQPHAHFGRVYAAYGGLFIVASLLWGWGIAGQRPDRYDLIGALVCAAGAALILYAPRS